MKMKKELMKRVAAAGLAVSMVAGLTACGPTGKPEETKKEETKAEGGETSAAARSRRVPVSSLFSPA